MNKFSKILLVLFVALVLTGIKVDNPAPDYFSTALCARGGACTFQNIIHTVLELAVGLSGTIAVGLMIMGGYQIVTARGNDEAATSGRKTLTNAIIGLVVIILSYVIVTIVVNAAYGHVR